MTKHPKVLIVEDNPSVTKTLELALAMAGYASFLSATNYEDAMKTVVANPDITSIIVGGRAPVRPGGPLDPGVNFVRQIRGIGHKGWIIAFSGDADLGPRLVEAGCHFSEPKPFADRLISRLRLIDPLR